MYIPPSFRVEEFEKLNAVIEAHSFATLITHDGAAPFATQLPMLFQSERGPFGTLVSHMARANPQWLHFENGEEVLTIFQGPHAYISPSWYEATPAVPTWNYVTVHAYGVPKLITDEAELEAHLQSMIVKYESRFHNPWLGDLPTDYTAKMLKAIVGFEIPIRRLEGKFKLGQNRSSEDRQGVYNALSKSSSEDARQLAEEMKREGL